MNSETIKFITEKIIEKLQQGVLPWQQPWNGMPINLVSKKPYRGINVFLLAWSGFNSPYWATYKQISELGGHVKKGEKGTPIVYWNFYQVSKKQDGKTEITRSIPFMRHFSVFNATQCVLPDKLELKALPKIMECEKVIVGMPDKPVIKHEGLRAYYIPKKDEIHIPGISCFKSPESYYSTLYHELIHSTGLEKRLDREGVKTISSFGSDSYSKEELISELGAAYLCGITGIETRTLDNSAAYIAGWLKRLANDRRLIFQAASSAQKAVDWILGGLHTN